MVGCLAGASARKQCYACRKDYEFSHHQLLFVCVRQGARFVSCAERLNAVDLQRFLFSRSIARNVAMTNELVSDRKVRFVEIVDDPFD